MANWFAEMGNFLGGWPDDYLVVDLETNGLDTKSPAVIPTQLGWCLVRGREAVDQGAVVLDWTRHPGVDVAWLRSTLEATAAAMAKKGGNYHTSIDVMQAAGVPPREALEAYHDLIGDGLSRGLFLAGHNVVGFDCPLLVRSFRQYLKRDFAFDPDRVLDTGLIEKARMMKALPPLPGEKSVAEWYRELAATHSRVTWNLGRHCTETYDLPILAGQAHEAAYDCKLVHLLAEKMRAMAGAAVAAGA